LRVHDVPQAQQAVAMYDAVMRWFGDSVRRFNNVTLRNNKRQNYDRI
jgi:hypothetical protein